MSKQKNPTPMRVLTVDIEITFDIIATYGLKPPAYHNSENIIKDWHMICFAWKWLDGEEPHVYSLLNDKKRFKKDPCDDYAVVERLHGLLSRADVIVGHNVDRFDWKKFMSRCIYHGLPPIPKPAVVDTYKEAKKLATFTSNKLSYLTKYLKIEEKLRHSGDMWLRILRGDPKAIRECAAYCKGDIQSTEALYLKLRPYMDAHPNHNLYAAPGVECCPKCASTNIQKSGTRMTRTGRYPRIHCQDCGAWSKGSKRQQATSIS